MTQPGVDYAPCCNYLI